MSDTTVEVDLCDLDMPVAIAILVARARVRLGAIRDEIRNFNRYAEPSVDPLSVIGLALRADVIDGEFDEIEPHKASAIDQLALPAKEPTS